MPDGWLLCDGKTYLRSGLYEPLFNKIYDKWGVGDGVTTFNVPDLRGVTLRGSNKIIGTADRTDGYNDPDFLSRVYIGSYNDERIGSFQMDTFQEHKHMVSGGSNNSWGWSSAVSIVGNQAERETYSITSGRYSSESRAKNAAVHYIIKY